jgi:hypothetical protein
LISLTHLFYSYPTSLLSYINLSRFCDLYQFTSLLNLRISYNRYMGPGGGRSRRIERIGLIVRIGRIGPIGRTGRTDGSDGLTDRQVGELQDSNNFPTNIFGSRATAAPRKGAHGTPMGGPLWRMDQNTCVITKINTTKICVLGWRSRPQKGMQMTATTHIMNTCTYIHIYIHVYIHIHIYIYISCERPDIQAKSLQSFWQNREPVWSPSWDGSHPNAPPF